MRYLKAITRLMFDKSGSYLLCEQLHTTFDCRDNFGAGGRGMAASPG
jgi:hypothetical protein